MKHRHEYEAVYHPSLSSAAKTLGIKAAEMRKCKTCQKEMPFVMIKKDWFPLFEDPESVDQGILMAWEICGPKNLPGNNKIIETRDVYKAGFTYVV